MIVTSYLFEVQYLNNRRGWFRVEATTDVGAWVKMLAHLGATGRCVRRVEILRRDFYGVGGGGSGLVMLQATYSAATQSVPAPEGGWT